MKRLRGPDFAREPWFGAPAVRESVAHTYNYDIPWLDLTKSHQYWAVLAMQNRWKDIVTCDQKSETNMSCNEEIC